MQLPLGPQGPPPNLFDAEEGERRKAAGMALVDAHTDAWWKDAADTAIHSLAALGIEFTADEVRELVGDPPRPNAIGARFNALARTGLIHKTGYRPAVRAERHRAIVAVWVGA